MVFLPVCMNLYNFHRLSSKLRILYVQAHYFIKNIYTDKVMAMSRNRVEMGNLRKYHSHEISCFITINFWEENLYGHSSLNTINPSILLLHLQIDYVVELDQTECRLKEQILRQSKLFRVGNLWFVSQFWLICLLCWLPADIFRLCKMEINWTFIDVIIFAKMS